MIFGFILVFMTPVAMGRDDKNANFLDKNMEAPPHIQNPALASRYQHVPQKNEKTGEIEMVPIISGPARDQKGGTIEKSVQQIKAEKEERVQEAKRLRRERRK